MVHYLYFLWKVICIGCKTIWLDEKLKRTAEKSMQQSNSLESFLERLEMQDKKGS